MSTMTLQPTATRRTTRRPTTGQAARPAVRPAARQAQAGEVRLTRRGRLLVLAVSLGVLLFSGLALAAGSVATAEPGAPEATKVLVVGSGDTLWDIASEAAALNGTDDVREMVVDIQQLNDLESGMLQAGQSLLVPLG